MGKLIFITGGVRSGKSAFAENYAKDIYISCNRKHLIYLASGVAFDEEMQDRIHRHQKDRMNSKYRWETIEVPDTLPINPFNDQHVVLWDCITTWLSNVLYKTENLSEIQRNVEISNYLASFKKTIEQWTNNHCIVLLVSNEVLDEQSSNFSEVNRYRSILGQLHQWIVSECNEAYEMDYSIVKRWK